MFSSDGYLNVWARFGEFYLCSSVALDGLRKFCFHLFPGYGFCGVHTHGYKEDVLNLRGDSECLKTSHHYSLYDSLE